MIIFTALKTKFVVKIRVIKTASKAKTVNVVNDKMKSKTDNDTIGILLCKGKNEVMAEYALKGYNNAIGVSDYQISKAIPKELVTSLPQIEDLENELRMEK